MFARFRDRVYQTGKSVEIVCACGIQQPVWNLFFCHHSNQFVCDQCSIKEIDTYFSPSLLISTLSNSAFNDHNRCAKEWDCPVCGSTLRTYGSSNGYHRFICEFCRWDSKEVGLANKDASKLSEEIRAKEFPLKKEFEECVQRLVEENDRERQQSDNLSATYGSSRSGELKLADEAIGRLAKIKLIETSLEAKNESCRLPEKQERKFKAYQDIPEGQQPTTIQQRLLYPSTQPMLTSKLFPARKPLMTKIAHRCPTSNKYVVKPTIGASHTSFDVCNIAIQVVPTVTMEIKDSTPDGHIPMILYFKNPMSVGVCLTLDQLLDEYEEGKDDENPYQTVVDFKAKKAIIPPKDDIIEDIMQLELGTKYPKTQDGIISFGKLSKVGVPVLIKPVENMQGYVDFRIAVVLEPQAPKGKAVSKVNFKSFKYTISFNLGPASSL